jgi:hypothetical protein
MFVTGLLEEWMRKMEEGRQRRRMQDLRNNPYYYQAFLDQQRQIWTPTELFDKCCPQFLAGGNQQEIRRKDGTYSCAGGCHMAHPTITLFFDADKSQTAAILSHRLDPFLQYLDARVEEGTAVCKTAFYYELNGFVRSNLSHMRRQSSQGESTQPQGRLTFSSHLVKVALDALKESDQAQRTLLEQAHRKSHHAKHPCNLETLEQVLDICRQHRLGDDLDVLSIQCMQQTSCAFRRVAASMATQRLKNCQLQVTPFVDGCYTSGYSVFRRRHQTGGDQQLGGRRENIVAHQEHGRTVEYNKLDPILLCHSEQEKVDASHEGCYVPSLRSRTNCSPGDDKEKQEENSRLGGFSWSCEELSFANLEREFGDIAVSEYCGQKLQVHWKRGAADTSGTQIINNQHNPYGENAPTFDVKLANHAQKPEIKTCAMPGFSLTLDLQKMEESTVDDVTVLFQGNAKILECRVRFEFLVAAYARSLEPLLQSKRDDILKSRPLLKHEEAFLQRVRRTSTS